MPRFAAGLDGAVFTSGGQQLIGGFYRGAGDTPRPTAILLHGVPGVEKNLDIAYALRDLGWNCLAFHFSGSWGSGGTYSFPGQVGDVRAAADWLEKQPSVDRERLALVGMSMGGYIAFAAGAADGRFKALVPICPLADPAVLPMPGDFAEECATMLSGVTGPELQAQWAALPAVASMKEQLADRPILLVTAAEDEFFTPDHYRSTVAALSEMTWRTIDGADHVFSTGRLEMVRTVVDWLEQTLGEPRR